MALQNINHNQGFASLIFTITIGTFMLVLTTSTLSVMAARTDNLNAINESRVQTQKLETCEQLALLDIFSHPNFKLTAKRQGDCGYCTKEDLNIYVYDSQNHVWASRLELTPNNLTSTKKSIQVKYDEAIQSCKVEVL